ncbi:MULTISPECIES: formylglycine-generating enzyme family protein [unclassified Sphingomonas]|uniref:formylglycine-generating enzyme family protein n=1 Tax=unclassified Sphingomonas TaxID=196159 RepID=UPI00285C7E59|nr:MULTISPECIES: formylglycine-generating enzyme family protein [unclassified Sphingomonas]MDR6114726.1 sulfatase modifying factor 1 [Sphingomonas sp. SORGH_AS_0789]MDR6151601.1 sulfatase modifying factor 1 [Sphingomonas sp. SORGH_AS_0742]
MRQLPGGVFAMGSDRYYPEESPVRLVRVDPFWIDETPVTNRDFACFVEATGYRTFAEIAPDPRDYPGMSPEMARAGSMLFERTSGPVDLADYSQWWTFSFGTDWRHPHGPDSDLDGIWDHPVVHVNFDDATAYAAWAGKALPTEAEWEFAAWGGVEGKDFPWGDELAPGGIHQANTWQGLFPFSNLLSDGYERTSPVRSYPANGYGLYDMIGNVWEWTTDWYAMPRVTPKAKKKGSCCIPSNPRGPARRDSIDPQASDSLFGRKVLKGGSHLCAPSYCQRYRPAARHPQTTDSATSHIGFRCVFRGR